MNEIDKQVVLVRMSMTLYEEKWNDKERLRIKLRQTRERELLQESFAKDWSGQLWAQRLAKSIEKWLRDCVKGVLMKVTVRPNSASKSTKVCIKRHSKSRVRPKWPNCDWSGLSLWIWLYCNRIQSVWRNCQLEFVSQILPKWLNKDINWVTESRQAIIRWGNSRSHLRNTWARDLLWYVELCKCDIGCS